MLLRKQMHLLLFIARINCYATSVYFGIDYSVNIRWRFRVLFCSCSCIFHNFLFLLYVNTWTYICVCIDGCICMYIVHVYFVLLFGVVLLNMFWTFVFIFLKYLVFTVCFSCNFIFQCTFCINSISLLFGRKVNKRHIKTGIYLKKFKKYLSHKMTLLLKNVGTVRYYWKKLILLFSKDALNWSQGTVKTYY